jgi:hypothetical protein
MLAPSKGRLILSGVREQLENDLIEDAAVFVTELCISK